VPLNVADLKTALKQVFADGLSATDSDSVAEALADAIHAYVSAAEVDGVEVDVVNTQQQPIGKGTQTAAVTVS
jgi:hypothetical protein